MSQARPGAVAHRAERAFLALGGLAGLVAVAAGAIGAHMLHSHLDATRLQAFDTATQYLSLHAVALLALAAVQQGTWASRYFRGAGWCMAAGVLLFSGSLYFRALTGISAGVVAPAGGILLMAGWACSVVGALARGR